MQYMGPKIPLVKFQHFVNLVDFRSEVHVYTVSKQVALLWQRDRARRLLVEILQLQNIAIVWHYLRDPMFSRFYTIPKCDRHTHTDRRTDTRRRHVLRVA